MKNNNIIIAMALKSECRGRFTKEDIIYTGVGKINAAYNLTKSIANKSPNIVINLGSAGSEKFNSGELINCTKFVQRDMNVEPLGFEKWVTPFENDESAILSYGKRLPHLQEGICGTGDNFDVSASREIYNVVDMEAYALAKICKAENVEFICIKYITDGADGKAVDDWNAALEDASRKLFDEYGTVKGLLIK
ncbi:MAG: adenosylhomocysteine nucleosidase [Rickettsiales bacterium]|jgi:adenosylhomocysteine nucleosidase